MPLLALPLLALLALPLLALPLPLPLASPLVAAAAVPSAVRGDKRTRLQVSAAAVAVLLFQIGAGLPIVVAALPFELAFRGPRLG